MLPDIGDLIADRRMIGIITAIKTQSILPNPSIDQYFSMGTIVDKLASYRDMTEVPATNIDTRIYTVQWIFCAPINYRDRQVRGYSEESIVKMWNAYKAINNKDSRCSK